MARFPVLDIENIVQENDKTRLNAEKSFQSGDSSAISAVDIKPNRLGAFIPVYNAGDSTRWHLDWSYTFEIEVDALNNKLDFKEGATSYVATLSTGLYTLSSLASEIQTQMNAVGGQVYTVSVSSDVFTISASGSFQLLPVTGANAAASILPWIEFDADTTALTSHTGEKVKEIPYYISYRITTTDGTTTKDKIIRVISSSADRLFSSDDDLKAFEYSIYNYLPAGRASFLNVHRQAQSNILEYLDRNGYVDTNRTKFTRESVIDTQELKEWSKYMALRLIFEGVSNDKDDVFRKKASHYESLEIAARSRAVLRLDIDNDGDSDVGEEVDVRSGFIARR